MEAERQTSQWPYEQGDESWISMSFLRSFPAVSNIQRDLHDEGTSGVPPFWLSISTSLAVLQHARKTPPAKHALYMSSRHCARLPSMTHRTPSGNHTVALHAGRRLFFPHHLQHLLMFGPSHFVLECDQGLNCDSTTQHSPKYKPYRTLSPALVYYSREIYQGQDITVNHRNSLLISVI